MKTYTLKRYILGQRCEKSHSGNRGMALESRFAVCQGCGSATGPAKFESREAALRADLAFFARWPEDSAADVLAGKRI